MQKWNEFKLNYPKGFYIKEYKGYTFVVFQHPRSGHLNGYVELKLIDEELLDQNQINKLDCHGGITYQGNLDWIFKTPKAKYIGFDCAHLGDKTPFVDAIFPNFGFGDLICPSEVWRDEAYIEENCKSLIDQLIELQKG
jgi:hypothetical protein